MTRFSEEIAALTTDIQMVVRDRGLRKPFAVTPSESEVFGIRSERFPAQMATYMAWMHFTGSRKGDDAIDFRGITQARARNPFLIGDAFNGEAFAAFAQRFGTITRREADAIFQREWFRRVGRGEIAFSDDRPLKPAGASSCTKRERTKRKS